VRAGASGWLAVMMALGLFRPLPAAAQATLAQRVEDARTAWLDHDVHRLVASSDTMRLELPGMARAPAVKPAQAARVLQEYLQAANEMNLALEGIRPASSDHAYAQLVRRYVVRGTSDERVETLFLGFRQVEGVWRLREVRVTP
jgi:hypothetical protein